MTAAQDPSPVVATTAGPVRGRWAGGSARFLGIPYAAAPVGSLRFAAPQPHAPWTEVRDATAPGATAQLHEPVESDPVTMIPEPSVPGDEILNVSVFTPDPLASLPVLVWIHGGGYLAGSAASPWYDGAAFNRDGVVTVNVGYRLGVEGFLPLEGAPDNRAVLDWIAALEWVRDNIAAFGGDPTRVTVGGQSAGGGAVMTLLAAPAATGLFHAAIAMSPIVVEPSDAGVGGEVAAFFTVRTGLPATAAALEGLSREELARAEAALGAPGTDRGRLGMLVLAPWADGTVLPEPVQVAAAAGRLAPVPLVLGTTTDEFVRHEPPLPPGAPSHGAIARMVLAGSGLDPARAADYFTLVPEWQELGRVLTDTLFRVPTLALALAREAAGQPTWCYEFAWTSNAEATAGLAGHCLDLPFAFDLLGAERVERATGPNPPPALADDVHGAWVRLVREGDPGWPAFVEHRAMRRFGVPSTTVVDAAASDIERWAGSRVLAGAAGITEVADPVR